MTETAASHRSLPLFSPTASATRTVPPRETPRRMRLALPAWLPRRILQRGGIATRDDVRALHDLRAAQDRSEW